MTCFVSVRELVSPRIEVSLILPQNKSQQQLEQAPGLAIGEEWGEEVALGVTEEGLVCEGGMLSYGKCPLMPRYVYEIKTMLAVPLLSIVVSEKMKKNILKFQKAQFFCVFFFEINVENVSKTRKLKVRINKRNGK